MLATLALMAGIGTVEILNGVAPATPALGVLALLLVWYAALGRPALRCAVLEQPARHGDYAYLAGLVLLVGLAVAVLPSYATLQVIAYPTIWTIVARYRNAVLWSAVLALATGTGYVIALSTPGKVDGLAEAAVIALLSFVFAVAMGTWITRIFEQGERYRKVAEQLRRTQAEVSELSQAAGAAAERERMSRELHDTLTQTLTGLVMLGEQADRALAAGQVDRARERLGRVQAASRAAVEEARALVATTQPLGDGGLEEAIDRVASRLRDDTGLRVRCGIERLPLDREQQVVLLRATQEGLANARRHAQAHAVVVALRRDGADVLLTVDDDGIGSDVRMDGRECDAASAAPSTSGFGLTGLSDRVRLAGGHVRFGSHEGGGSRLAVRLPLADGLEQELEQERKQERWA
ncbi:sensor histidine kinase [Leucobacter soli]|uniref:sensor histidine kinase n=1 Tax=Leucobacter soli TaxID=2812850 RepID=UPI0036202A2B